VRRHAHHRPGAPRRLRITRPTAQKKYADDQQCAGDIAEGVRPILKVAERRASTSVAQGTIFLPARGVGPILGPASLGSNEAADVTGPHVTQWV
jgi:hypothetical protein